jgi:hypothetical protein
MSRLSIEIVSPSADILKCGLACLCDGWCDVECSLWPTG